MQPGQPGGYQYPFAQYPYAQRHDIPAGYVGPQWAAPLPAPPQGSLKKPLGCCGCVTMALGTLGAGALIVAVLVMCAFADMVSGTGPGPTPTPTPGPTSTVRPPLPPSKPITARTDEAWGGTCIEVNDERDRATYHAYRNSGSARKLRGKIALLHIRLRTPDRSFTSASSIKLDAAAIAAKDFWMREAKKRQVSPLAIELVPWKLDTPAILPTFQVDRRATIDPATQQRIREAARRAVETALDSTLEKTVARYRQDGYDEVGFFVYMPVVTTARAFAWFAVSGSSRDFADAGYIFAENRGLGPLAYTVTHEGLHLFGADDLYRVLPRDPADAKDLMNDTCTGLGKAVIGDTTAYAIGWTPVRPARRYTISEF